MRPSIAHLPSPEQCRLPERTGPLTQLVAALCLCDPGADVLSPLFALLGTVMSITVSQAMLSCLVFFFFFKTWVSDFCFMLRIIVAFGRKYFKLGEKAKTKKKCRIKK